MNRFHALTLVVVAGCSTKDDASSTGEASEATLGGQSCLPSAPVDGVDVSEHNGAIDWQTLAAKGGVVFAFIKATQGSDYVDPSFAANWPGAKRAGVVRGAYHFFDPNVDGDTQARHFLATIGAQVDGDLPPMLDLECPDGDPECLGYPGGSGDQPGSVILVRATAWLSAVQKATGRTPIVYTFGGYLGVFGGNDAALGAYPLFVANVGSGTNRASCVAVPAPWSTTTFWQWDWHGQLPGIPTEVDVDHFLGSKSDLLALAHGAGDAGPPPSPGTCVFGDGDYCGGNGVPGDPLTLYRCTSGTPSAVQRCALGCARQPDGEDDVCASGTACPYGDGLYCGGDGVGGDPNVLYTCRGGRLSRPTACASGCARMPIGQDDACR